MIEDEKSIFNKKYTKLFVYSFLSACRYVALKKQLIKTIILSSMKIIITYLCSADIQL